MSADRSPRFRMIRQKYLRFIKRLNRLLNTQQFQELSKRKRTQLKRRLTRYQRQYYRLAGVAALTTASVLSTQAQQRFCQQADSDNPFDSINVRYNSAPSLGDVDGDGDLDLVIDGLNGIIRYYENDGVGNYVEQTNADNPFDGIDVGSRVAPILVDIDGDGHLDLVIGARDGLLYYYKNDGVGNYAEQTNTDNPFDDIDVGGYSYPTFGDIDSDGDLDLVVGNENDGLLFYYENDGIGNYTQETGINNPFDGIQLEFGGTPHLFDLDRDGDMDLITGENNDNLIHYYENDDATGNYTELIAGDNPFNRINVRSSSRIGLGDINGDGNIDFIIGGINNFSSLLYYKGCMPRPLFCEQINENNPLDGGGTHFALADVDGDGDLDIVAGSNFDGSLSYSENDGAGNYIRRTFNDNPFHHVDVYYAAPVLGDLDSDGDLDLVVGGRDGLIYFYENVGGIYTERTGAANPFDAIDVGGSAVPSLGDVDNDGDLDLVTGASDGTIHYLENVGGVYTEQIGANNPFDDVDVGFRSAPSLGDLDSDGDLDLLVGVWSPSSIQYYKNDGTGNYIQQQLDDNPFSRILVYHSAIPVLADVDEDGDVDLVLALDLDLHYYENCTPPLPTVLCRQTGSDNPFDGVDVRHNSTPSLGDLDGDGDLDMIVTGRRDTFLYYTNDGTGLYTEQTEANNPFEDLYTGYYHFTPHLVDLDNDGDLDLVVGERYGTILYYENDGTNTFTQQIGANNPFDGIDVGDYSAPNLSDIDGDEDLDLIIGSRDGTIHFYENIDGIYTEQTGVNNPFSGIDVICDSTPTLGDVDGDGDLDLVIGESEGTILYYENDGSGNYTEQTGSDNPFNGIDVGQHSAPTLEDVDGDGDLDVVIGNDRGRLSYYENTHLEATASIDNCTTRSGEVEITINSTETTGIYRITGDFSGTIGSTGVMGGTTTVVIADTIGGAGTYEIYITSDEDCRVPLTVSIDQRCSSLPVELLYFQAKGQEGTVQLDWSTASELNNSHFLIERSADGKTFEPIGKVLGAGTTLEQQNYDFVDESPLKGINYYRLQQFDHDGSSDYSEIRVVNMVGERTALHVFPIPATTHLNYQIERMEDVRAIHLFDLLGKCVKTDDTLTGKLDISDLPKGQYLLVLESDLERHQRLVVKQ